MSKSKITTVLICWISFSSIGQSLEPTVVGTAGQHFVNGSQSLEWTMGEPVISTYGQPNNILTQGFHQPTIAVAEFEVINESIGIDVFPNPAVDWVTIRTGTSEEFQTTLLTETGSTVQQFSFSKERQLDLTSLASGMYFLHISRGNSTIRTFKITKK